MVAYLELLRVPYTGCNPRGLLLSRDKSLSKKLLAYHRLPVPDFAVFRTGRKIRRPKRLSFPLIVKSLTQDASIGIAQASIVEDEAKLQERVTFIHDSIGTDAIVERYVEGRELYVGIVGNERLQVFPIWEMHFTKMPDEVHRIATDRVKWNVKYQQKHGIETGEAADLPPALRRADPTYVQARLPNAGVERVCADRFAVSGPRQGLRAGSQPEPAYCVRGGFCGVC